MIRQRAVFDAVRDAIFVADIETGMIVDANPAAEALCGRALAELRSLHHTQLHPTEAAERVPGITEGHVLHKDGHRIPVLDPPSPGPRTVLGAVASSTCRGCWVCTP